jgi:hypothetical protein
MEPEGTEEGSEIGPGKIADTGSVGQPVVQGEDHTIENNGAVERDLAGRTDPIEKMDPSGGKDLTGKKDPAGQKDPARVKGYSREKEHRIDMDHAGVKDSAEENESGRVNGDPGVEKEHRQEAEHKDKKDPEGEKCSGEEHHAGSHPGLVPDLVPGIDQPAPDATVPPGGTGKKKRIRKLVKPPRPITEVHRKTEIFGMSAKPGPDEPARIRRRTERNLKAELGLPYSAAEKGLQDLVCSLVERQDRVNAGIALDIHIMQEDIGILKDQVYRLKTTKGGLAAAAGEKK